MARITQKPFGTPCPLLPIFFALLLVRCGDAGLAPGTSSIQVEAVTTGTDSDPNGYSVVLDGAENQPIPANGGATFAGVVSGEHHLELQEIAPNCTVNDENP